MKLCYVTTNGNDLIVATEGDVLVYRNEYDYKDSDFAPCKVAGLREMSPEERRRIYLRMLVAIADWHSFGELVTEWDESEEDSLEALLGDTCVIEAELDTSEPETDEVSALKAEIAAYYGW